MKLLLTLASLAALGQAALDLESLFAPKDEATKLLRAQRDLKGIDPDEWCKGKLASPECWHEFTELVWQPLRFKSSNQVSAKQGRKLYWCVMGCNIKDDVADWYGKAHEEKRETREEFLETNVIQGQSKFLPSCQHCCKHIPVSLRQLPKVKSSCPEFNEARVQSEAKVQSKATVQSEPTAQPEATVESETTVQSDNV